MAIAAVDVALWDLKARLLGLPLCTLLGAARERVPVYGSGGFTVVLGERLAEQLARLGRAGDPAGEDEGRPRARRGSRRGWRAAREAIGPSAQLFVDANGAYSRKQALELAERFRDDAARQLVRGAGLLGRPRGAAAAPRPRARRDGDRRRRVRLRPAVLRADARRRRGRRAPGRRHPLRRDHRAAARRRAVPRAQACRCRCTAGPPIHLHPALALEQFVHLEYFHDHVRIERLLFDGVVEPRRRRARARPRTRPGIGLELKRADAERYAA